jgi:hypothetical protein
MTEAYFSAGYGRVVAGGRAQDVSFTGKRPGLYKWCERGGSNSHALAGAGT